MKRILAMALCLCMLLVCAGACANGQFFCREYPASGTSIQMCFTMGRIAGTNAAEGK